MGKRIVLVIGALVLAGGLGLPAYGWDSFGHMAVAYVAYQKLTPQAKTRGNDLLKLNPKYSEWKGWVPAGKSHAGQGREGVQTGATRGGENQRGRQYGGGRGKVGETSRTRSPS